MLPNGNHDDHLKRPHDIPATKGTTSDDDYDEDDIDELSSWAPVLKSKKKLAPPNLRHSRRNE